MRLICYPTSGEPPDIVSAPVERPWMDATDQGFAYRCLPLNIANAHGWMILNPQRFVAQWDGGRETGAISVMPTEANHAMSHFGSGILTLGVNALFRTEPGYDLYVTGPVNEHKDGIHALSAIVETDWAVATFTMNWRFTRKYQPVVFEKNEPFCMIFPVQRGMVEQVEPEIRSFEDDPAEFEAYTAWAESRRNFNEKLKVSGSAEQLQKWQKEYFRGKDIADHRTKLRPREFKDTRRED